MKRFFYGIMAAGLLLAAGCGNKEAKRDDAAMSAEELARAEEEAVKELAKIIAEEAAEMPVAEMDADEYDAFDYESLSDKEKAQLMAWEAEAEQWAREQMALEEQALQTASADDAEGALDAAESADAVALTTAQADNADAAVAA